MTDYNFLPTHPGMAMTIVRMRRDIILETRRWGNHAIIAIYKREREMFKSAERRALSYTISFLYLANRAIEKPYRGVKIGKWLEEYRREVIECAQNLYQVPAGRPLSGVWAKPRYWHKDVFGPSIALRPDPHLEIEIMNFNPAYSTIHPFIPLTEEDKHKMMRIMRDQPFNE